MQRAVERYVGIGARGTGRRLVRLWWFAGAAAAAAVVLCAIIAWRIRDGKEPLIPPTVDVAASPLGHDASPNEPLTVQRCRLALRESPETLFALLDRQAVNHLPPTGEPFRGGPDAWQDGLQTPNQQVLQ